MKFFLFAYTFIICQIVYLLLLQIDIRVRTVLTFYHHNPFIVNWKIQI